MVLALFGVTGIGKSFFVDLVSKNLNFEKVHTIRTRAPRSGENLNYFMTSNELDKLEKDGKLAYRFSVFDGEYAYLKEEIFSEKNMIFEMHYTTIFDWKKVKPDIKTIYIMPTNLEKAKEKTRERHLPLEKEIERLNEIDEHFNKINSDENLRSQFDYIFYNNYDEESTKNFLNLVKQLTTKNEE